MKKENSCERERCDLDGALNTWPRALATMQADDASSSRSGGPSCQPLLRVGLVGCSWFALRSHIPALERIPGCSLVAVCSRTRKSMAKAEAKIGREVKRHAKMEQMFADKEVDVVLLVLVAHARAHARRWACGGCCW